MKGKIAFLLIVLVFITGLSGCSTIGGLFEDDDSYEAPPAALEKFTPEFEPGTLWSVDVGDGSDDQYTKLGPLVDDGMVFAVDHQGQLSSYDASSGQRIWENDLDVEVNSGPGGGDGLIFQGTKNGGLIAIDEKTGKQLWQQHLSSEVLAPAKVVDDTVVVRTADGRVDALSTKDGSQLWSYQRTVPLLSLRGTSTPVIVDDKVIAGYDNGKLVALSISDGKVIWEKSVAVPRGRTELDRLVDIDADPVVKNDTVYAVTYHGRVAALSIDSGDTLWFKKMSSQTGLDVAEGTVYISDDSSYVWAIQDGSGDSLWRQTKLLRRSISAPTIVGNYIVVGDFEGYLHWLDRSDGHFVARQQIADGAIRSKPLLDDGVLYVTANDGTLTAIKAPE